MANEKKVIQNNKLELINAIALKRGFFWPSAESYGGKAGFFSYGHLGKSLKNNFEALWREYFIRNNDNCYEVESSVILPEQVFVASGHLQNFNDPMVECNNCHFRFRADQFIEDNLKIQADELSLEEMNKLIKDKKLKCPKCNGNSFSEARWFNMMFPLQLGAAGTKDVAYLTPETAQGSFLSFKREFEATRKKLPLGIGMIGKAFRNEISPRQLFFRLREFSQAELQMFFDPEKINDLDEKTWKNISKGELQVILHENHSKKEFEKMKLEDLNKKQKIPKFYLLQMYKMQKFYLDVIGLPKEKFRFRELGEKERAFYNKIHFDIECYFDIFEGFKELGGIHYRTDHDLSGHEKQSKDNLHVFFDEKSFIPHVIELSLGIDRNILAFLDLFFKEENERTIFSFPTQLSPIIAAVFPLVNKEGMPELAEEVYDNLKLKISTFYDDSGSIGKRYRRADEIGIRYCITVDGDSIKDKTVTIRDRDSMKQKRVKISELGKELGI